MDVLASGSVQRWIETRSTNAAASDRAEAQVQCDPVTAAIHSHATTRIVDGCVPGNQRGVEITDWVDVNGATRAEHCWRQPSRSRPRTAGRRS